MGKRILLKSIDFQILIKFYQVFKLDGEVTIEGQKLGKRDGFGIWNINQIKLNADSNARVLLMEVPMTV